ncbi:MAG: LytTR family DNA-binding domain-containing protein [Bacteroidota bacterium]
MKNTISVAIIDDESDARSLVKLHLERHSHLALIGEAEDGVEAQKLLKDLQPDLIFLDIQMPGYNGIEVLKRIVNIPHVIFITAYDDFAVKAFELNAIDYLLKPFTAQRFDQAVSRATNRLAAPITQEVVHQLIGQFNLKSKTTYLQRLPYKHRNVTEYIDTNEILFIKSANQYVEAYVEDRKYLIRQSLDHLEKQLSPEVFIRIHRSVIVRLSSVKAIQQDEFRHYQVILHSGETLPLSQVRKPLLVAKLNAE